RALHRLDGGDRRGVGAAVVADLVEVEVAEDLRALLAELALGRFHRSVGVVEPVLPVARLGVDRRRHAGLPRRPLAERRRRVIVGAGAEALGERTEVTGSAVAAAA